jgi:ABC-type multidrug transport system fused ATPase/permease subunit
VKKEGWFRRLAPFLGPYRRRLVFAVVMAVVGQMLIAFTPLVQQVIVDNAILTHRQALAPWVGVLVVVGVLAFAANYSRRRVGSRLAIDVQRDLQLAVHRHLQHLDFARHDELRTGDVMSRATSDITLIQMFLQQLSVTVGNAALLVVALVVMLVLSPLLTVVIIVCIPVFGVVAMRFRGRSFPASWMDQRYEGVVAGVVEEAVTGVRVVKAFGQEQREQQLLREESRTLFQSRMRTARITARFSATLQAVPTLGQLGVLALGGWLALRGHVSLGVFLAFSSYVLQLVTPVRLLTNVMATAQQARAGAERVLELLAIEPVVADRPGARPLEQPAGRIDLEHVSFAYQVGKPVLDDVSLHVDPGERVAIVGASGSGKSTLALLLGRFYEASGGTVRLDGEEVGSYTLDSLRRAVGMVFEESFLFSTTIRDNIRFGRPGASDDDIVAAATIAHAHDFIVALPDGYDTAVGERGFTLSGGERQRIALARAALANHKVLVIDDATSAIDAATEEAIFRSFEDLMAGRTTVLIAHRPSTLRLADRVILLDRGRVAAVGTNDELVARSPLYRQLLTGPEPDDEDTSPVAVGSLDPLAWPTDVSREGAPRVSSRAKAAAANAGVGRSHGGGVAAGTSRLAGLATASPALLAAAARLPALRGDPKVDLSRETEPDDAFSFRRVIRPFRAPLALGGAFVALDALSTLAGPLLIRAGIDDGVVGKSIDALAVTCAIFLGVQIVSWVNSIAMTYQTSRTAERILFSLRVRTFAHLQRLSLDYYDQEMAGRIMTRMTSDIDAFAQLLQQGLLTAMTSLLASVGVAVALVLLQPKLALMVAVVVPPLVVATMWFRWASARAYLTARMRISMLYADLQESLAGVRVSQSLGQQPANEARFARLATSYRDARVRSAELIARFFPLIQLLSILAKAIALAVGAQLIDHGNLTPGVLIAFLLYLDQFFAPVQQLSSVFDQWAQARVAVTQVSQLLRTPTTTPDATRPLTPGRLAGHLRFDGVRFAYPSTGLVAMHGLDLEIPAGQVVALVGTTGAGKSTLVKLVARFYDPVAGTVLVDGIPLRDLDLGAYRHQLGFVPQEPFLFSGTIRTNINYGAPDASDLEVERAARAVGAHTFIASLPHGYHTVVTEQGRSLSAGQRQLLCLARAHLVDPAILLLDEATSNLDLATEAEVQRAMSLVARGRTTLLIAHRLQTARTAQRILVVDSGRIVEDGSHEELLRLGGRYRELWSTLAEPGNAPSPFEDVGGPTCPAVGEPQAAGAGADW